jgi:glycosyltransferase involved in cell wall biosynthesis
MLHELISSLRLGPYVSFLGSVNNTEMPEIYPRYDISFNASPTGGIDKTVLESMASGVPVFVANIAFRSYLEDLAPDLMFAYDDADDLTRKVRTFLGRTDVAVVQEKLRTRARQKADLALLITVILGLLK